MFSTDPFDWSDDGWTYCLSSGCGKFCKIGRTKRPMVALRYSRKPFFDLKNHFTGYMSFVWAIKGWQLETESHKALDKHRLDLVLRSSYHGRRNKSERIYTCKKWLKPNDKKDDYVRNSIEVFAVSPAWAKRVIKKSVITTNPIHSND